MRGRFVLSSLVLLSCGSSTLADDEIVATQPALCQPNDPRPVSDTADAQRTIARSLYLRQRHAEDTQKIADLLSELEKSGEHLSSFKRRVAIDGVVALRQARQLKSQVLSGLRDTLVAPNDASCRASSSSFEASLQAAAANDRLADLELKLASLEREKRRAMTSVAMHRSRLDEANKAVESMREELRIAQAPAQVAGESQQATASDPANEIRLNARVDQLQGELDKARQDGLRAVASAIHQRQQHSAATQVIASLREELAASSKELAESRAIVTAAKPDDVAQEDATHENTAHEDALNAKVAELEEGIVKAQAESKRALASAIHQRQQHNAATQLVASLREELAASGKELAESRASVTAAKPDDAADETGANAKIAELEEGLAKAQNESKRALASAVFNRQKFSDATRATVALREEFEATRKQLDSARLEANTGHQSEVSQLTAKIADVQAQLDAARQNSQRAIASAMHARQQQRNGATQVASLHDALSAAGSESSTARAEAETAKRDAAAAVADLTSRLDQAQREAHRAIASAVHQRQKHSDAVKSIASLEETLQRSNNELADARAAAQSENQDASGAATALNAKIAELSDSLSEAQRNSRRAIAVSVSGRQQLARAEQSEAKLRQQLAEREATAAQLAVTVAGLRSAAEKTKNITTNVMPVALQDTRTDDVEALQDDAETIASDVQVAAETYVAAESTQVEPDAVPTARDLAAAPRVKLSIQSRGQVEQRRMRAPIARRPMRWKIPVQAGRSDRGIHLATRNTSRVATTIRTKLGRKTLR